MGANVESALTCIEVFTTEWDIKYIHHTSSFMTMCMNVAKEPIFIYR